MPTEKEYKLNGHHILVIFNDRLVRIKHPKALQKFLSEDIELRTETLVNQIRQDYALIIGKELSIAQDSMVIEIWGHAFASYFTKALKNLIQLKLIERISDFVIKRSDTIDCGESEVDSNRRFWDLLANFKGLILTFLPKKMK